MYLTDETISTDRTFYVDEFKYNNKYMKKYVECNLCISL